MMARARRLPGRVAALALLEACPTRCHRSRPYDLTFSASPLQHHSTTALPCCWRKQAECRALRSRYGPTAPAGIGTTPGRGGRVIGAAPGLGAVQKARL